jgi:KDO2-lipid IV(A) lauroyltransferase
MASRFIASTFGDRLVGGLTGIAFAGLGSLSPDRASDIGGALARRIGPRLPAHRIGQANLRAAYPDRDAAWIEETLRGAWENLGRVAGEYVHLARLWDYDPEHPNAGRIEVENEDLFRQLRDDGQPALCFASHLGNWELPAVAAAAHGMDSAALYRMPNSRSVAARIDTIRGPIMGRLIRARAEAAIEMSSALERGTHVGMLVDQHWGRGVPVTFFGRTVRANPTLARLARQHDCPIVGARVTRLPGNRFRVAAIGPIDVPRDAAGDVDVAATTQLIMSTVESWIRETPEQWLWFHRRWR